MGRYSRFWRTPVTPVIPSSTVGGEGRNVWHLHPLVSHQRKGPMSNEPTTSGSSDVEVALAQLLKQAEQARTTLLDTDGSSEAEASYLADAAQALSTMELELTFARATLAAERADTKPDLESTLTDAADAARRWIDDAGVQAQLGRMELQDRVSAISQYLDRARAEVIRAGERVSDVVGTELGDVRSATLSSIDGIRDVIVDAGRSIRAAGESLQE